MSLDNFLYSSSAEDLNYPSIRPTLDLNFIKSQRVPPFINVVRNSQTTYVDKFGILRTAGVNQPVFEWDPITGECLGARIWGVVTNRALWSEQFENAAWARGGVASVSVNAANAPTGSVVADSLVETSGVSEAHGIVQGSISVASGATVTASCWMKAEGRQFGIIKLEPISNYNNLSTQAFFNLQTGVASNALNCTARIEQWPNGWYRCSITATATATNASSQLLLRSANAAGTTGYIGDGRTAISLFGAQHREGTDAGPYVPTTTLAASSTADAWSITGADFNRIYNQSAVTFYAEAERGVVPAGDLPVLVDARNAAASSIIQIGYLTENLAGNYVTTGNVLQSEAYPSGLAGIRRRRIASAFTANDVAILANGSVPLTDNTATMPTPDRINLGSVASTQSLNGYIRQLKIFPKRLTNSQLRSLTR